MLRLSGRYATRSERSKRVLPIALLIGVAAAIGAVGIAAGAIGADDPAPSPGLTVAHTTPIATAASSREQSAFGILRRANVGSDALSASSVTQVTNSLSVKLGGMNAALARRATTGAGAVWVIPGNGSTCMLVNAAAVPPGATDLKADTATCMPDDGATAGKLVTSIQYNASKPPHEFIAGLVPDGVDHATVQLSDGLTQTIAVRDNVYTGEFVGLTADAVTFAGPAGDTVVQP